MDVNELAPPVISLVTPSIGLKVVAGREYILTPDIQNAEGATYLWTLNGNEVGTENTYTFKQDELGTYELTLTVTMKTDNQRRQFLLRLSINFQLKS